MGDTQMDKILDKLQKLKALRRARERVRKLERELNGEPAKPQAPPHVPEFLRQHGPLRSHSEDCSGHRGTQRCESQIIVG